MMKRIVVVFMLISAFGNTLFAQITDEEKALRAKELDTINGWKKGGLFTFNLSQAAFSDWVGGGENSINLNGTFVGFANYTQNNSKWNNLLNIGYGMMRQGANARFIKTDDKLEFNSIFGQKASKNWYYAALLNFKSQMDAGYNYPNDSVVISKFLAPGYLIGSLGMDYKPNENLSLFISPLTSKTTFVLDQRLADAGSFGVKEASYDSTGKVITKGQTMRNEFGGYVRFVFFANLFKDKSVTFLTKADFFSNYLNNPENIDVTWETILSFKVNKYITASISATVVYDDDIKIPVDRDGDGVKESTGPRTQFKEILAIGFAYKF